MSVKTDADEKLESTVEHLNRALDDLSDIVVHKCYGTHHFEEKFINILRQTFYMLIEIRDKLK